MTTLDLSTIQAAKVVDARAMSCPGPLRNPVSGHFEHHQVGKNKVEFLGAFAEGGNAFRTALFRPDVIAQVRQKLVHHLPHQILVIYEKDSFFIHAA